MDSKNQVVVISDKDDAHIPFVRPHLSASLQIIDPRILAAGKALSFELKNNSMAITYDGTLLKNVTGVWYRKPRNITARDVDVSSEYEEYSISALNSFATLLLSSFPAATWVNEYFAMWRANSKALQLEIASQLGFQVPATVMTSDPVTARIFIERYGEVIAKPFSFSSPIIQGVQKTFFATKIDKSEMPDLSNLDVAPVILQQALNTAFDVRVTVVGDRVFAAAIHTVNSDEKSRVRDWRIGQYTGKMQIKAFELPSDIKRLCISHCNKLKLRFGAIDLVMSKQGELWFLENNPNGQWAFIEKRTGQPIGQEIAKLLESKT